VGFAPSGSFPTWGLPSPGETIAGTQRRGEWASRDFSAVNQSRRNPAGVERGVRANEADPNRVIPGRTRIGSGTIGTVVPTCRAERTPPTRGLKGAVRGLSRRIP
jgi:hypothetical protein